MKVIILAGGKGTRGKPFTDFFPKAMIPINGIPLIDHVCRYLLSSRLVDEIIIVADFQGIGGQIKHYFEGSKFKKIKFIQDSGKGTAGDLIHAKAHLNSDSPFVLWFVDNFSAIDIKKMLENFKKYDSLVTIATRKTRKEETGFALVKEGLVTEFNEKPVVKMHMSECLGVYIVSSQILKIIKNKMKGNQLNFSFDILEDLAKKGKVSAFDIGKTPWLDIESPTYLERNYKKANQIIQEMK